MNPLPDHFPESEPSADSALGAADFDQLLADAQPRLRGYLASILGAWADVDDLLQETNLILLRKRDEFQLGTHFMAWAFRVAYFKASTWRRDRSREGRVVLRENEFREIAAAAEDYFSRQSPVVDALSVCMEKLPSADRKLLQVKYLERRSLTDYAAEIGCRANTLHKNLSRVRLVLRDCIRKQLASRTLAAKNPSNHGS
ncbi:MAG: sigma-70 family RNA polymerase sigma factor [Luteolibacter sp.]